ncbi:MAG: VOC family protein [Rhodospirillales bacterium]|nr:VOC family protein [Rhodospirillales bacterium]
MPMTAHGTFFWNELMTWSVDKAKEFYGETLGWQYESHPMADGGTYTLCKAGEAMAAGIFEMKPGAGFDGIPDHWFSYITVDDIDARLSGVEAAGGEIRRPAFDVPNVGRFAVVRDSGGAVVGWVTPIEQG